MTPKNFINRYFESKAILPKGDLLHSSENIPVMTTEGLVFPKNTNIIDNNQV